MSGSRQGEPLRQRGLPDTSELLPPPSRQQNKGTTDRPPQCTGVANHPNKSSAYDAATENPFYQLRGIKRMTAALITESSPGRVASTLPLRRIRSPCVVTLTALRLLQSDAIPDS